MFGNICWKRVLLAAVLSEVAVIVTLLVCITVYSRLIAPGVSDAAYQELGQNIGYYVAPAAGAVATFFMARWAVRPLTADHVLNGTMVGMVSVILTSGFILTARPGDRLMYLIAFALRIATGCLGGRTAAAARQIAAP